METLSRPVRPTQIYRDPGIKVSDPVPPISRNALNFEMTPRYEQITMPFKPAYEEPFMEQYENPYNPPRDVANVKTLGIKALSEPRVKTKRFARGDNASVIFEVSKNAIKAKTTEHTKKLAKPRIVNQEEPKENAFTVSRAALNPLKKDKLEYYTNLSKPQKRGE